MSVGGVVRSKSHRDRSWKSHLETELHLTRPHLQGLESKAWRKYQLFLKIHKGYGNETSNGTASDHFLDAKCNSLQIGETQAQNLLRGISRLSSWLADMRRPGTPVPFLAWTELAQERFLWIPNSIFMKGSMAELLKASPQEVSQSGSDGSSTTSNLGQFVSPWCLF